MSNEFKGVINRYIEDSTPWWPEPKRPPAGAPNVVYIVLDDTGFAHLECFGSDISTPNINRLAQDGLRYANFHTTAICSPTRACLLTGHNHHSVGMGMLADLPNGFPNRTGKVSRDTALLSEILQEVGYSTMAVGKWHLVPGDERTSAGPFDEWPLRRGFDRYYGFLGGETDQWHPDLVSGNEYIDPPKRPEEGYHLTEDLTDKAIRFIREQRSTAPDKPFFLYLAYGATHAPHHAPKEFIDKYAGKYDKGWDVVRQEWFERQKQLGIIPQNTVLPPRNPGVKAWDELTDTEKRLFARMQEVFAGYLEHTDYHIGRLIDALKEIGEYDNTVIVLVSDNGASPEGQLVGTWNEHKNFNQEAETAEEEIKFIDKLGGPEAYNHYPVGWAQVGNTPLKWYKTFVHAGGVKCPLVITYPAKIKDKGGIRHQYHHAIDIVPTILDLIGIEKPETVKGVRQRPLEGTSMVYSFDNKDAESARKTQYYEMLGNRGIYHDGWKAVARHIPNTPFDQDVWELYHVAEDFSETNNLADQYPEKLQELIDLWWKEAEKYQVLPLDGRGLFGSVTERPGSGVYLRKFYPVPGGFHYYGLFRTKQAHSIEVDLDRIDPADEGVLVAEGGRFGGWALYVKDNRLVYAYNFIGERQYRAVSQPLPVGPITVRMVYEPEGQGGTARLFVGDQPSGEVHIPKRAYISGPGVFALGKGALTAVNSDYEPPFAFQGTIKEIRLIFPDYQPVTDAELAARVSSD